MLRSSFVVFDCPSMFLCFLHVQRFFCNKFSSRLKTNINIVTTWDWATWELLVLKTSYTLQCLLKSTKTFQKFAINPSNKNWSLHKRNENIDLLLTCRQCSKCVQCLYTFFIIPFQGLSGSSKLNYRVVHLRSKTYRTIKLILKPWMYNDMK